MFKKPFVIGVSFALAFSAWNAVTMFYPVSYLLWDVIRSGLFIGFIATLGGVAVSWSGASFVKIIMVVTSIVAFTGTLTLIGYVLETSIFRDHIVQLPQYTLDYTHHGYTSPQAYLATNYIELIKLEIFAWTVGGAFLAGGCSFVGWLVSRLSKRKILMKCVP